MIRYDNFTPTTEDRVAALESIVNLMLLGPRDKDAIISRDGQSRQTAILPRRPGCIQIDRRPWWKRLARRAMQRALDLL